MFGGMLSECTVPFMMPSYRHRDHVNRGRTTSWKDNIMEWTGQSLSSLLHVAEDRRWLTAITAEARGTPTMPGCHGFWLIDWSILSLNSRILLMNIQVTDVDVSLLGIPLVSYLHSMCATIALCITHSLLTVVKPAFPKKNKVVTAMVIKPLRDAIHYACSLPIHPCGDFNKNWSYRQSQPATLSRFGGNSKILFDPRLEKRLGVGIDTFSTLFWKCHCSKCRQTWLNTFIPVASVVSQTHDSRNIIYVNNDSD